LSEIAENAADGSVTGMANFESKEVLVTSPQFDRVRRLALSLAGIEIIERHRDLLRRRCRRAGIIDSAGLEALIGAAEAGEESAGQRMISLLTTSFTGFFRNPWHFDAAAEHAVRPIERRGHARLWCAASATGEEPYSLAMALIDVTGREDPPASILATDINSDALALAERGEYDEPALRSLANGQRARFFGESAGARCWRIAQPARSLVEFRLLNLISEAWPLEGPFDVVFCCNLLMYLETRRRCAILERMAALIGPDSLLILDPTEHPGQAAHLFGPSVKGVYTRGPSPHVGRVLSRVHYVGVGMEIL
jgi:chemotaxis protein methyltransferase CheR